MGNSVLTRPELAWILSKMLRPFTLGWPAAPPGSCREVNDGRFVMNAAKDRAQLEYLVYSGQGQKARQRTPILPIVGAVAR
jgi:hypothetical protein